MSEEFLEETPETIAVGSPEQGQQVEQDIQDLSDQLEKLTLERDELQQQVLRTMADFQNYRKRTLQDQQSVRQLATENLLQDLIPVLDNLERTVAHLKNGVSAETMMEGVGAVERQLRAVLESQKLVRIHSVGMEFDPVLHEAIGVEVTADHPENTVAVEVEPGYRIADKIIRPARVKVAKAP